MRIKIKDMKSGMRLADFDGLELIVKEIKKVGYKYAVTTNYVENGFYKCADTTRRYNGEAIVNILDNI
jgi:hypothetical protein